MAGNENRVVPDEIDGDRGLPSINDRGPSAAGKRTLAAIFMGAVLLLGMGFGYSWFIRDSRAKAAEPVPQEQLVKSTVPEQKFDTTPPPPPPEAMQPTVPAVEPIAMVDESGQAVPPQPTYAQPSSGPAPERKPAPRLDAGLSSLMIESAGGRAGNPMASNAEAGDLNQGGPVPVQTISGGDGGPLGKLFASTRTEAIAAGNLSDRSMTLAKGSFIDCVLQTRIDTTVPGMATCVVTRNVFSDNGKVVLIERGSTVTGEYSQGLKAGQARVFVLWTRVKTPQGVTMNLDSPGTDPLGASGLPGKVNYHFFQRFGAALLLSAIDGGMDYAAARASRGSDNVNYYGGATESTRDLSEKILEKTIDIPPTLYKNQGDRINILVARDLYFGNVYGLRPQ